MTVSGHCGYSLKANAMSRKNYDLVDYDGSETVKCYLAAQMELEMAMESLIRQLEEAGIADDTVIVISPRSLSLCSGTERHLGKPKIT